MTSTISPGVASSLLPQPAAPPPPGVIPSFQNAPNMAAEGRALLIVGLVIMLLVVAMRLFTQWFLKKVYVMEDYLMIMAVLFAIPQVAVGYVTLSPGAGGGYHIWDVTVPELARTLEYLNLAQIFYSPCYAFVKLAILVQLRRIFIPSRRVDLWFWSGCWLLIIATPIIYVFIMMFSIFQCWPREKIWNPYAPGHCVTSVGPVILTASWYNVLSDFLILALPLPAIYKLHMKPRKKWLVAILFTTGGLAGVVSIIRLCYSYKIVHGSDPTWTLLALGVSVLYEYAIGVIVFCMPITPRFGQFVMDKVFVPLFGLPKRQDTSLDQLQAHPTHGYRKSPGSPERRGQLSTLGVSSIRQYLGPESRGTGPSSGSSDLKSWTKKGESQSSGESHGLVTVTRNNSEGSRDSAA